MSIVEDLLLLLLFLFVVIKYILLQRKFENERNYFIDTLSHDLRVSAIAQIRALEVLRKSLQENSYELSLTDNINESCQFSLEMITMLLNSFKYERQEIFLKYEKCDVQSLFAKTIDKFYESIKSKNIQVIIPKAINFIAEIDKSAIEKVLSTFISIAIQNSQFDSKMVVLIKNTKKDLDFTIIYKGNFLSEEEYRRMFMTRPNFSTVGRGIEMHLCKKIIDFHRGKISVKKLKNNLNMFTFSIPLNKKKEIFKTPFLSNFQPYKILHINKCFVNNFNKN